MEKYLVEKMTSNKSYIIALALLLMAASPSQSQSFSGNVDDLMASLRDVIGTAGEFVGDKNGCTFQCKDGGKPKVNPRHTPSSNGCGSFGIKLEDHINIAGLTQCCDKHDFCYDTCNNEKDACDRVFKKCMERLCKKIKGAVPDDVYEGCKSSADLMYAGTAALGCKPYKDAQVNACLCKNKAQIRQDL